MPVSDRIHSVKRPRDDVEAAMKTTLPVAVSACLFSFVLGDAPAAGQSQYVATYSIVFESAGAVSGSGTNAIQVSPGSLVTSTVQVTINPGIGAMVGNPPGPVIGHSDGYFSIAGTSGAGAWTAIPPTVNGVPHPALIYPYNCVNAGYIGVSAGTNVGASVNGVLWGVGPVLFAPHPLPMTSATVWSWTFQAGGVPGVSNFTFTSLGITSVYFGMGIPHTLVYASAPGMGGSIAVVPSPAGLAVFGIGGFLAARRRR